jgi:hypothetical protein
MVIAIVWIGAGGLWFAILKGRPREVPAFKAWSPQETHLAILLCCFAAIYLPLFDTHMLKEGADGALYSGGGSALYDIPFHAALTTAFVHGENFPPVYPPLPPHPLLYPGLPDFLTATLMVLGLDLHGALVSSGLPLAVLLTGIFWCFARRVAELAFPVPDSSTVEKKDGRFLWAAGIASLLFLFNGGLGFVYFFHDAWASSRGLIQFLSGLEINYAHHPPYGLVWPNIIADMLLPQRTSLFGLALGLIVFSCFTIVWQARSIHGDNNAWEGARVLSVAGLIAGLLPYFHTHSYLAVGLVSVLLFLLRPSRVWFAFWIPAIAVATPQLLEMIRHISGSGFVRFLPGWWGHDQPRWIMFWIWNVGIPGIIFLPAWAFASREGRRFYLAFVALLLTAMVFVLSPNEYDNLKLMYYWFAATMVLVGAWLVRLWLRGNLQRVFGATVILGSIVSGVLAIVYEWQSVKLVFSRQAVAAAEFVKTNTIPHAIFLTASTLHHPIPSLTGRRIVRGPTSWLWSHGYPFVERDADVRAIYRGREDAQKLLQYYRVDYIYVGDAEISEIHTDSAFLDAHFPVVYRDGGITIYDSRGIAGDPAPGYQPREYSSRIDRDPAIWLTEYSRIAYTLYCYEKVILGRAPRYSEFVEDLRELGRNVYPTASGWLATLETNKRAMMAKAANKPEFQDRYGSMSAPDFLTALYRDAGITLGERTRAELLAALERGTQSRASIAHRVAEESWQSGRDYNSAYVLIHYFAFFHRDPDQPPDRDLRGFDFWLGNLERSRDYRAITRAFIESAEYRDRQ